MTDIRFTFAGPADASRVSALIERAYRGEAAARGWTNEAEILSGPRSSPKEVAELIADANSRFVIALDGDRLVGCALIRQYLNGTYFGMFAIDPDRQGDGLGKLVMTACEGAARKLWRSPLIKLTVISLRDELIAWYERRGYRRTGEREPFPFAQATGALRTDFDLIVLEKPL